MHMQEAKDTKVVRLLKLCDKLVLQNGKQEEDEKPPRSLA